MTEGRKISGTICSGVGAGAAFMSLGWVREVLRERLGFAPYPATLNLRLETQEEIARWAELRGEMAGVAIRPPDPSFCEARCWHVSLTGSNGRQAMSLRGAVLFPQVANYPADKIEVVCPVNLKDSLGVRDGDRLTLEFCAANGLPQSEPHDRPESLRRRDALAQVKVLEFGAYAAGPCIGKYLANFGAEVVHVESAQRPDGFRLQYPPFKDGRVGLNRSGCFAFFNDSKYGVTLDLKHAAGLKLAYRLAAWADIVIENMRPGVMARLGLGHERLRALKPGLVVLSTSNMGQTGPHAAHPGFGSQLSSLSGFTHLIGRADGPPNFLYGPYIDFIAVAYGGIAVLAALDHRRRTGEGAFIDLSQYEAGLQFIGGALLDYAANGVVAHRAGNRDEVAAPHGCYPCRAGQWCVISCWDDAEWERLCRAAGQECWLADARFKTAASRKENEDELNRLLASWTRDEDARRLMCRLQTRGVHAAQVNTVRDLFTDPQIAFRDVWQKQTHPELGEHSYRMVSYSLSETPGRVRRAAPCLAQDNEEIFLNVTGLSEQTFRELEEQGVFS